MDRERAAAREGAAASAADDDDAAAREADGDDVDGLASSSGAVGTEGGPSVDDEHYQGLPGGLI